MIPTAVGMGQRYNLQMHFSQICGCIARPHYYTEVNKLQGSNASSFGSVTGLVTGINNNSTILLCIS